MAEIFLVRLYGSGQDREDVDMLEVAVGGVVGFVAISVVRAVYALTETLK